ncbi:major capsid protein (plasmid) [Enterobacter kobei]|uniref:major capsid protein n=1 Tax=Enterobacter kobei TaxID=208224 RepID=UPI00224B2E2E|nr:major capsid protein [Enterobacter kobei]UZQ70260.1 major capsid protein [Enterobacter kobei]
MPAFPRTRSFHWLLPPIPQPQPGNHSETQQLCKGRRAFGDAGQNIICWAINSDVYYSLVENDLFKNAEQLYKLGDIAVFTDGLNGRFLVTDYVPSNTAYGMVNGAVIIDTATSPSLLHSRNWAGITRHDDAE